jgi:hypothetical protein
MMRDFVNATTMTSGGVTLTGAASGQLVIGILGLVFMILFGVFGAWLRLKDSRALRRALEVGDIKTAMQIRSK